MGFQIKAARSKGFAKLSSADAKAIFVKEFYLNNKLDFCRVIVRQITFINVLLCFTQLDTCRSAKLAEIVPFTDISDS